MDYIYFYSKTDLKPLKELLMAEISIKNIVYEQKETTYYLGIRRGDMHVVSFFLAQWLDQVYRAPTIKKLLENMFSFLSQEEQAAVENLAREKAKAFAPQLISILQVSICRMEEVSNFINLDGFALFGKQEYQKTMMVLVEESLEAYQTKLDYLEFLDLMHDFMKLEVPQLTKLYVIIKPNGSFQFFDSDYFDITNECMELFMEEFSCNFPETEEEQNDLLLSVLITLVPEKILIYDSQYIKNPNFLHTLKLIFNNRIYFLEGAPNFLSQN